MKKLFLLAIAALLLCSCAPAIQKMSNFDTVHPLQGKTVVVVSESHKQVADCGLERHQQSPGIIPIQVLIKNRWSWGQRFSCSFFRVIWFRNLLLGGNESVGRQEFHGCLAGGSDAGAITQGHGIVPRYGTLPYGLLFFNGVQNQFFFEAVKSGVVEVYLGKVLEQ